MSIMKSYLPVFSRPGDTSCVANCSIRPFGRVKDGIAQIFQTHNEISLVRNLRRGVQEEDPSLLSQIKTTRRVRKTLNQKVLQQQLTENWLLSLASSRNMTEALKSEVAKNSASAECFELCGMDDGLQSMKELPAYPGHAWVLGIDPDVTGAVAVLKTDDSGSTAQVFDAPSIRVLVGKRVRRRLDARSMVSLIRDFGAPTGSFAYIEQSTPFPKDGKQGWWSGGFGYGLWIGVLVALGFSVIPVPSVVWKNHFELAGRTSSKDESRAFASSLFPALSSQFKRKKDHGRAEALLIAAYGRSLAEITRS